MTNFHSNSVGRNDPCPCGSGRKYKKCCMSAGTTAGRPTSPHVDEAIRQEQAYLLDAALWLERLAQRPVDEQLGMLDEAQGDPPFPLYAAAVTEVVGHPTRAPLVFLDEPSHLGTVAGLGAAPAHERLGLSLDLLRWSAANASRLSVYDIHLRHLDGGRVWAELQSLDLSFEVRPDEAVWPLLVVRHSPGESLYAHQFVASPLTFLRCAGGMRAVPVVHHAHDTYERFERSYSFVHELLHVLQRVGRKRRAPAYAYADPASGRARWRNLDARIAQGIGDELEVAVLLSRLFPDKYPRPSLNAVRHHVAGEIAGWRRLGLSEHEVGSQVSAGLAMVNLAFYARHMPDVEDLLGDLLRDWLPS